MTAMPVTTTNSTHGTALESSARARRRFAALLAAILVALFAPGRAARAQSGNADVSVSAQLDRATVYVNDTATLTITVENSSSPDRPFLHLPDGVDAEFLGGSDNSSTFTAIINGSVQKRVTHQYVFTYHLTAAREGIFQIPPAEVAVNGKVYRTQPLRLAVVRPEQGGGFALRLEADKTDVYVGESTRLHIVWALASDVKSAAFSRLPGLDSFTTDTPRDRVPDGRANNSSDRVEVNMLDRTVVGTRGAEVVNGQRMTTLTFDLVIVPNEPGTHELGPMSITFDAVTGERPRGFFDAPWDDRSITRRMSVMSDPITIRVKPLPDAGKPADFTGLVGQFTLKTSAEPRNVSVGDPITLKLIADGPDPTSRIEAPDLARIPGFDAFRLSSEGWHLDSGNLVGPRAFSTTIRAGSDKIIEIPPISLAYFDTEAGEYTHAVGPAIPLSVRPTREVTSADAVGAMPLAIPLAPTTTLDSAGPGPVANAPGASVLADEGAGLLDTVRSPLVAGVLIAPPLAFFGALMLRVKRDRDAREDARVARARREAAVTLKHGPRDAAAVAASLRRYAGAVLGINPDAVTPFDCAQSDSPRLHAAATVLSACDADRFGNTSDDVASLAARALAAIEGRAAPGESA